MCSRGFELTNNGRTPLTEPCELWSSRPWFFLMWPGGCGFFCLGGNLRWWSFQSAESPAQTAGLLLATWQHGTCVIEKHMPPPSSTKPAWVTTRVAEIGGQFRSLHRPCPCRNPSWFRRARCQNDQKRTHTVVVPDRKHTSKYLVK